MEIMGRIGTQNASLLDVDARTTMSWSAVIGGWLVATAITSLMYVAGFALGFAAFDPYNAAATAKGIGVATVVWLVLSRAVSLFLGGMFASWFDGKADQTVGALHGITVWGLSVTTSGLLLAFGLTQVVQGGAAIVRGGVAAGGAATLDTGARSSTGGPLDDAIAGLQAQLTQRVAQTGTRKPAAPGAQAPDGQTTTSAANTASASTSGIPVGDQANSADIRRAADQVNRQGMAAVAGALIKGNVDNAKTLLAANTSMSQSEIDQTLQGISAQVDKYKAEIQAAADKSARYISMMMWIIFFSHLLALIAAAIGGWLGAGQIDRVHNSRHYETTSAESL
jgi:hypothetical protein